MKGGVSAMDEKSSMAFLISARLVLFYKRPTWMKLRFKNIIILNRGFVIQFS